eukprot:364709-Chlamydomonas_euryale.AAC.11
MITVKVVCASKVPVRKHPGQAMCAQTDRVRPTFVHELVRCRGQRTNCCQLPCTQQPGAGRTA